MVKTAFGAFILSAALLASAAHAQVALTPLQRTGGASGPYTEQAAAAAKVKPCKKNRGGLLGAIKRTGLAGVLTNEAAGGGLGGYAASQVANVAVEEGARAEQETSDNGSCK